MKINYTNNSKNRKQNIGKKYWILWKVAICDFWTPTHTHTQPFNSPLSWTTRVGRYQKKHSPTHTHPDHQTSFINFLHRLRSIASSLFDLRAWQSFSTTSLQVLFGLPLGQEPCTSYSIHFFIQSLSSFHNTCPYHSNPFCCSTEIMNTNIQNSNYRINKNSTQSHGGGGRLAGAAVLSCLVWWCELTSGQVRFASECVQRSHYAARHTLIQTRHRTHLSGRLNSHHHTRHDKTVQSVSCLAWWCELDNCY